MGIQALLRLTTRRMAERHGVPYLHVPFLRLAHQEVDPIGEASTVGGWASRWESFLGLGEGAPTLAGAGDALGDLRAAWRLRAGYSRLNSPPLGGRGIHTVDLDVMRRAEAYGAALDAAAVAGVRRRFARNGYAPPRPLYDEDAIHVALHIRRGDVWENAPTQEGGGFRVRFLSEAYYVDLLERLTTALTDAPRPVRYHVFSDGRPEDFPRFRFLDATTAELDLPSGRPIRRIAFHLRRDTFDTLYHLAHATLLVPAKSAFSVLALLVGDARVLYHERLFELGAFAPVEWYLRTSDRAGTLADLGRLVRGPRTA